MKIQTMKPITYNIVRGERGYPAQFHQVNGLLLFDLYGYQWAAHLEMQHELGDFACLIVSEVSTGFELESGKIFFEPELAKEWAWKYLIDKGEMMVRFHVERARMKLQEYDLQKMSEG